MDRLNSQLQGTKALVAEDEPFLRLAIVFHLVATGFEVLEAANADEALDRISRDPAVAVLVTNVNMPGSMDGVELARLVKSRLPHVRVVIISAKHHLTPAELPDGAVFIHKPVAPDEIARTLLQLVAN